MTLEDFHCQVEDYLLMNFHYDSLDWLMMEPGDEMMSQEIHVESMDCSMMAMVVVVVEYAVLVDQRLKMDYSIMVMK